MKKILVAAVVLCALAFTAAAGVTNITVKVTTEIAGVGTNNSTLKVQQDGTAKDALMADGTVFAYQYQVTQWGQTNTLDGWLKDQFKAQMQIYASAKAVADYATQAAKINKILTEQPDLLSTTQKNQLAAIAALIP